MIKSELIKLIDGLEEGAEIDDVLKGTELFKSGLSLDSFKELFTSDDNFKKYLESENDKHFNKALKTWKDNNLKKLVDAELLKKNPQLTEEQLKIQELEKKFELLEKEKQRAVSISKFKDVLVEKNIPMSLIDYLINDDDDVTTANIDLFENAMKDYVSKGVENKLKNNQYTPPSSNNEPKKMTREEFKKLGLADRQKLYNEDLTLYNELSK